jgi:hypothetical protein
MLCIHLSLLVHHSLVFVSTPRLVRSVGKKKERVYIFDAKTTRVALALNKEIIFLVGSSLFRRHQFTVK